MNMEKLFNIKEAAQFFGVSKKTVRRLTYNITDPLPYFRIGRLIRFHEKDLMAYRHFQKPYSKLNGSQKAEVADYGE